MEASTFGTEVLSVPKMKVTKYRPEAPAQGTSEQSMVRLSCVFSAVASCAITTVAFSNYNKTHAPKLLGVGAQCLVECLRALLVWLQLGRTCGRRTERNFIGGKAAEERAQARAELRLQRLHDFVWYSAVTLGFFLTGIGISLIFMATNQLANWFATEQQLLLDARARSTEATIMWPCFFLFGAVFALRYKLSCRLDCDLVSTSSWSALMVQLGVLILIVQGLLLDHHVIQVHAEWCFTLVMGLLIIVDGCRGAANFWIDEDALSEGAELMEFLTAEL